MDHIKEYHDPDYPEPASCVKEEPPSLSEEEKIEKIKSIIRREISNELEARESEVLLIDQRMSTSRRLLHRLRYAVVSKYYSDQKLHLNNGQIQDEVAAQPDPRARTEVANLLSGQHELHPSVRKLLGKRSVDMEEIFRTRSPRNKTRKDYVAMLQKRNYTISADSTKSLRPGREPSPEPCSSAPKKVPRHFEPRISNVVTLVHPTRNKIKHRYRIIIGNTSKYVPAASRLDRSTHKWLLYIRGPANESRAETTPSAGEPSAETDTALDRADLSRVVTAVSVTLHHSYAPHHIVHLDKPPFHISRRGWGEFPAKVELHFPLPARNRPASVSHNIRLDRNYTGVQVLGSETVVDVWLYSTPEMMPYEFKEDDTHMQTNTPTEEAIESHADLLPEIKLENTEQCDENWMDFFTKAPTELDVDEMIIRPTKKQIIETPLEDLEKQIAEESVTDIKTVPMGVTEIKTEPMCKENEKVEDSILQVPNEIFNQPTSIKKRIVKYIDPTTGKIYYLEMDRELDLTKVQEIIINNTAAKISPIKSNGLKNVRKKKSGGISLLKPEIKSLLQSESNKIEKAKPYLSHIENDHCYLAAPKVLPTRQISNVIDNIVSKVEIKKEENLFNSLCSNMHRFGDVRAAVNYLVKHIPLISQEVRDPDFMKHFPFVVESSDSYWKLDFAKRRNVEWSRAKLINRILTDHSRHSSTIWRTKQILLYLRMHGHYPVRNEMQATQSENNEWSSWNDMQSFRRLEGDIKETYPRASDINTLTAFEFQLDSSLNDTCEISDDEDIDILSSDVRPEVKRESISVCGLEPLPVDAEEDRLRFLYVERKCQHIGIELRNEDVGSGYSHSAVHAVLVSAMKSFAEELVRSAAAEKRRREQPRDNITVWTGSPSTKTTIALEDVYSAAQSSRLRLLTSRDIGTSAKRTYAI